MDKAYELCYTQVEREALAVICVYKSFTNIYLVEFVLISDHKPLVGLFGENTPLPPMASARIHRWAMILSGYSYKLRYKPGQDIDNADACSRLPLQLPLTTEEERPETVQFLQQLESSPILARDVGWTEQDPILSRVQYYVHHGWPNKPLIKALTTYWRRASELSIEEGCVLWGQGDCTTTRATTSFGRVACWSSWCGADERLSQNDSLVARTGWGHRTQGPRLF